MKIIKLQSENVKRIKAIEIRPDGAVVRVTGKNAEGKTSVLDSILYALGGDRAIPSQPIRKGASKAHISMDLGEITVERNITRKGSYLKVTGKDGKNIGSPQKMLDTLIGKLSFDPLAFSREAPKKQADILRQLAGLDLSDLDAREQAMMEERRDATATGKALAARLEAMDPPPEDCSTELLDIASLQAKVDKALAINREIEGTERLAANIQSDLERAERDLQAHKDAMRRAEQEIAAYKAEKEHADANLAKLGEKQDVSALTRAIQDANDLNATITSAAAWRELAEQVQDARDDLRRRNSAIESLRESRTQRIAEAKYPLEGIGISEESEVLYNGLPISQASLAEQLKVSTAVAMSLNPKLRVLRITDGSLLDSESMAIIESLAKDNDYQVWVEQVDETGQVGFYIEDGSLVSVDGEAVSDAAS